MLSCLSISGYVFLLCSQTMLALCSQVFILFFLNRMVIFVNFLERSGLALQCVFDTKVHGTNVKTRELRTHRNKSPW
ncbi:hypothetical protein BDV29DRAFT_171859 [Aspergillus leporis]|uniref:Uncharacterized protein n=1 Tax=Aspergillus leporis TaxID=41062 RepID=A0A5N5X609_9EURO|nr:hypothetical protein BDV29DRAFT_171859 [Aspergillus leporis]